MKVAVPLDKNVIVPLATMASVPAIDGAIQRKVHGRGMIATNRVGVVRTGKVITLVISNEDIYDCIRLLNSSILIDLVTQ